MKKNVLWMLAALMLAMVTVSCSSDDDNMEIPMIPNIKNAKVIRGDIELPNEPVDIETLPQWIYDIVMGWGKSWGDCILLEGIWQGEPAYWHMNIMSSYYPDFFYMSDGSRSRFKDEEVDWSTWKCIYHVGWYTDYSEDNNEE